MAIVPDLQWQQKVCPSQRFHRRIRRPEVCEMRREWPDSLSALLKYPTPDGNDVHVLGPITGDLDTVIVSLALHVPLFRTKVLREVYCMFNTSLKDTRCRVTRNIHVHYSSPCIVTRASAVSTRILFRSLLSFRFVETSVSVCSRIVFIVGNEL